MSSSVLLLLILQLLWIRSSYNDEVEVFRKETNNLFRSTIISLQDSMILKNIQPVIGDSNAVHIQSESGNGDFWNSRLRKDSLILRMSSDSDRPTRYRIRDSTAQIQIFVSSTEGNDSIKQMLRPIVSEFRRTRQHGNFVFRIGGDSLRVKNVQQAYLDTLLKSGIEIPPRVKRINLEDFDSLQPGPFYTDPFYFPRAQVFIASFEGITPKMLAGISPQIMFSVVLTALIITAFILMYRTLLSQQKLVELKNDLISNITHELKTPVATVSVVLEALKNFKALDNPALTREYLDIAQSELSRLTLITDKILKTSVFEQNGLTLKTEAVDVAFILQQVLSSLKLTFEKTNTRVVVEKEEHNFIAQGNAEHLTNVIYNLIDNALKYSKQDPKIDIRLKKSNNRIIFSIADNGIGIPGEYTQKIFEKFFRVPTGDVHNAKGYGLGLSYVASVVKAHHGEISVESEVGKGSTFIIEIPCE